MRSIVRAILVGGTVMAWMVVSGTTVAAASCESLASTSLRDATVTLARPVPAGEFTPEKPIPMAARQLEGLPSYRDLPAFCRVVMTLRPTAGSDITVEVWMPLAGWNGRLVGSGNGGAAGFIRYPELGALLAQRYAVAGTNTGHDGVATDWSFALGHPEKVNDLGYRAVHEMAEKSKAIVAAFYGRAPRHSYWNGCSTGGRQGLTEAQRFPEDFDGIRRTSGNELDYWLGERFMECADVQVRSGHSEARRRPRYEERQRNRS
jgi:feruloyl esterase